MARKKNPKTLESQLASVVEQDGVILNTPHGVRRKKKRPASKPLMYAHRPHVMDDPVVTLDRETVNLVLAKNGGASREVPIQHKKHARSPYVVSLQRVLLSSATQKRNEQLDVPTTPFVPHLPSLSSHPIETYASVSSDLSVDHDPWDATEQFTPATFQDAYRASYGRFNRVTHPIHELWSLCKGFVTHVEHVEKDILFDIQSDIQQVVGVSELPRFSFVRAIAAFAALALIMTLPANAFVLYRTVTKQQNTAKNEGREAMRTLLSASNAASLPESASALRNASSRFRTVEAMLAETNALALGAASLLSGQYRNARALAEVGEKSSEAARLLTLGFDKVFTDPERHLDERLDVLSAYARGALTLLSDASKTAATIHLVSLPAQTRGHVTSLLTKLEESHEAVREFAGLADVLARMAGKDSLRNYLLLFQNHTELRPTGGFMGSFAEVMVDRGVVKRIRVPTGGTYELKGMLLARVRPPKPLQLVAAEWQFHDANWSPDFPTSAKHIRWFWNKSRQATLDGVIAINSSFIEKLIGITGPIELPEYGKTINETNFLMETQKAVELEYDRIENTPKKFIGALSTKLFERLQELPKNDWLRVAALLSNALETKEIQLALSRSDEEELAERYGWNGRLKETPGDSLALIEANIAGQKTDGVIRESVDQMVQIREDGSIQKTITLTRTHEGKKGELFRGARNVSYLRVYVPQGSTLLSVSGFNAPPSSLFKKSDAMTATFSEHMERDSGVWDEGSRTVFGGWMQLDPGATQTITLTYRLPHTTSVILSSLDTTPQQSAQKSPRSAYLLLLTSQSGKTARTIRTTIHYPQSWDISWARPEHLSTRGSSVHFIESWDRDRSIALLFSPHVQTTH